MLFAEVLYLPIAIGRATTAYSFCPTRLLKALSAQKSHFNKEQPSPHAKSPSVWDFSKTLGSRLLILLFLPPLLFSQPGV
jgi:hypothetical protein